MRYGVYDTKDDCWIGNDEGPRAFDDPILARVAAQLYEYQVLGTDLACRFRMREIPDSTWHLRDKLKLKHTTLEALIAIEGGGEE